MGLFDIFRKKFNKENNNISNSTKVELTSPHDTILEVEELNKQEIYEDKIQDSDVFKKITETNFSDELISIRMNYFIKCTLEFGSDYAMTDDQLCCSKCAPFANRYYSISGNDSRFPKLPEFFADPEKISCCGLFLSPVSNVAIETFIETKSRGDIIAISNRPFKDNRTEQEKINYEYFKNVDSIERRAFRDGKSSVEFNSGLAEDGKYDFTMLTDDEKKYIDLKLSYVNANYSTRFRAIALADLTKSSVYKPSYIFNEYIIKKYSSSTNPLDELAVAIAYERKGAKYRKQAIEYYKRYEQHPENTKDPNSDNYLCNYIDIHSSLATLYEKEHLLEDALKEAQIVMSNSPQIYKNVEKIGNILTKMNINRAVEFYQDCLSSESIDENFKSYIESLYKKSIELQQKNYVYKPRKIKPNQNDIIIDSQISLLTEQFL